MLLQHLHALVRQGLVSTWHDQELCPGDLIDPEIQEALAASDFVILLISPAFLSSNYCFNDEMRRSFERQRAGTTRIVPIIARPCQWRDIPVGDGRKMGDFLALPQDGLALTEWPQIDSALDNAVGSIRDMLRRDQANASRISSPQLRVPEASRGIAPAGVVDISGLGILATYDNRAAAEADIRAAVMAADWVRVLSNKGDDWLSEDGILAEPLKTHAARGDRLRVEMLLLHINAPWLLGRAMSKGFWRRERAKIEADFSPAHDQVIAFSASLGLDPPRFHRQDPAWRFMMTDQEMFLQTYKTNAQIMNETVVRVSARSPLYGSAARHFEYLYELASAPRDELSPNERFDQKTILEEKSAGYVVTRLREGKREVLVIFKDDTVALPKGGIESADEIDEPLLAARRELFEETGLWLERADGRFLDCVLIDQPLPDTVARKLIIFFHLEAAGESYSGDLKVGSEWADEARLDHAVPAYDYIPQILARVGFRPRWRAAPFRNP